MAGNGPTLPSSASAHDRSYRGLSCRRVFPLPEADHSVLDVEPERPRVLRYFYRSFPPSD